MGNGLRRLGDRGLLPLPGKAVHGHHLFPWHVPGRSGRTPRGAVHHPGGLRWRARRDGDRGWPHGRAKRNRGDAELRADASVRSGRDAYRARGQGTRVADAGKHLGGELGQPRDWMGVRRRHTRLGRGPVSRGGTSRGSCDQGLHWLPGAALPELRAVAGRASAPTAVHLSHDTGARLDECGSRGAVSAPAAARRGDQRRQRGDRADADAGPRRNRGATESLRLPEGGVAGSRVADRSRQPGRRRWLCAAGEHPCASDRRQRRGA